MGFASAAAFSGVTSRITVYLPGFREANAFAGILTTPPLTSIPPAASTAFRRAAVLQEFRVISPNSAVAGLVMLSTCTSGAVWD